MAAKLDVGLDAKRGDLHKIDPFQLIVAEEWRGRWKAPSEEKILSMALSLHENGQQQPVKCRRLPDGKLKLVVGFTRVAAARLLRSGFVNPEGVTIQNDKFLLEVTLSDLNDEEAFKRNIIENNERNPTSPIDDAFNHRRCREQLSMTNAEITRFYNYTDPGKVGRYQKLLGLSTKIQELVHDDLLSVQAAIDLLDLPEEQREAVAEAAKKDNGKIDGSAIRSQVRDHHLRDDEEKVKAAEVGSGSGKKSAPSTVKAADGANSQPAPNSTPAAGGKTPAKPRTIRDVRTFLDGLQQTSDVDEVKKFCETFTLFLAGRRTDTTMKKTIIELAQKK